MPLLWPEPSLTSWKMGEWTQRGLDNASPARISWCSHTAIYYPQFLERRSALRLAFLLAVYNFQFLRSFTDKICLAELGNMTTWMMPANYSQKSFSISLPRKWNNANVFQIISSNSLQVLCIENLFCVWGQRFVTQNNWWIEIQIHSAWGTSLLFAATVSGWIILQIMYFPCLTFPINPLPAYTLWVWGCSWPPHVDQRFLLLKAFCCSLAVKTFTPTCKPQSPFSSPGNIPALPAVTWAVPLQAGQQHYQRHAAQWNSAKALHMFYAKENITFGTMFCTRSQLPPEYRCRTCQNKPNCSTSEVFCIFLPNCVQVCWIVWGKFIVLRNTKGWTV